MSVSELGKFSEFNPGSGPNDVSNLAINLFVNRCPLTCRLARKPWGDFDGECRTAKHSYEIAASSEGDETPVEPDKMRAMKYVLDDFEDAVYKDVRRLLKTNNVTEPENAGAYKPMDLIRDAVQRCIAHGGKPDAMVVSADFFDAFSTWGCEPMRLDAGVNPYGVAIDFFEVPFVPGMTIIPSTLLHPGTAICLSSGKAGIRIKRNPTDVPSGPGAGEIVIEGAAEIEHEAHHAWVSGVTGFAVS